MIERFRHKGLRQLFEDDNAKGVNAEHLRKLRQILATLNAAETIEAMRLPTFGLHALKGDLKGFWAVTVRELASHLPVRGWQGNGRRPGRLPLRDATKWK